VLGQMVGTRANTRANLKLLTMGIHRARRAEAVLREAMRFMPPIGAAMRMATRDFELEGHLVRWRA
jgi:cytochrome P450